MLEDCLCIEDIFEYFYIYKMMCISSAFAYLIFWPNCKRFYVLIIKEDILDSYLILCGVELSSIDGTCNSLMLFSFD